MNLMDYSLLVGIHDIDKAEEELNASVESEENGVDEEGNYPPASFTELVHWILLHQDNFYVCGCILQLDHPLSSALHNYEAEKETDLT